MLNDIFAKLYKKQFYDYREHPVQLTEYHKLNGPIDDTNRRIRLGERVLDFDGVLLVKHHLPNSSVMCSLRHFENLAFYNVPFDITVFCVAYDETHDVYTFNVTIYRGDTLDIIEKTVHLNGPLSEINGILFETIVGNFYIVVTGLVYQGTKIVMSLIAYSSEIIVVDSLNVFVGRGDYNALYFNTPSNAIILNDLPEPQANGSIEILIRYTGIGSVIRADDLNDIINIVKYYNLLPKFDVVKYNNNDIKVYIRGEYYYLGNRIEKYSDMVLQVENDVLVGFQCALVGYLDMPNNVFGISRVATALNYDQLINELSNFIIDNPDVWIPIFILIFDNNKNLHEYSYINNKTTGGSGISVLKYAVNFSNATQVSLSMLSSRPPVVSVYDNNGYFIIPDSILWIGNVLQVTFASPVSGVLAAVS